MGWILGGVILILVLVWIFSESAKQFMNAGQDSYFFSKKRRK